MSPRREACSATKPHLFKMEPYGWFCVGGSFDGLFVISGAGYSPSQAYGKWFDKRRDTPIHVRLPTAYLPRS